jgi:microsomal dipeptidase-like Zn-dependent dipeptidase
MPTLYRRDFLRHLTGIAASLAALPRLLLGDPAQATTGAKINDFGIVDLHCHPSLKMYLWGRRIWKKYPSAAGANELTMQITTDELSRGYVKGILCAHYLIERAFTREPTLLKTLFPWIERIDDLAHKVEYEDAQNFTQINIMMDDLEDQLHRANQEQDRVRFTIARSFPEFSQALSEGRIPVAHAIEGAHALGRNLPLTSIDCDRPPPQSPQAGSMHGAAADYIRNLEALKARGVCLMAIGHIFENDIAFPVEGISADEKKKLGLHWVYEPARCERALPPIGRAVVERMLDIGMIVDLTHATPAVRKDVFQINRDREKSGKKMRPLTFTHTGSRAVFDKYDDQYNGGRYKDFGYYDVDDAQIEEICECGGVIAVIPENFWLLGCDTKLDSKYGSLFKDGIEYMVETMIDINGRTGAKDFDNIAIGTDFDGFADAPRDLHKPSQLGALIDALRRHNLNDAQIRKITSLNALRLLEYGWTA